MDVGSVLCVEVTWLDHPEELLSSGGEQVPHPDVLQGARLLRPGQPATESSCVCIWTPAHGACVEKHLCVTPESSRRIDRSCNSCRVRV